MKVNYALVLGKLVEGDQSITIKHTCVYENKPENKDIQQLLDELATDEYFGMVGDKDFEIYLLDRSVPEQAQIIDNVLELPLEISENEDGKEL